MTEATGFQDLLRRLRAGDAQAAAELVRQYEGIIRCQARLFLTDPRMGRLVDHSDICQMVLASFFLRAASGQFDLNQPEDLIKLLVRMTRNKVASLARKQQARAADRRAAGDSGLAAVAAPTAAGPGTLLANRELLAEAHRRLTPEERRLAELWAQGHGWPEIAAELGGTPEALRKQLTRALDRVARELGLEEDEHG
jgi:RNA polymerase sigma-70 factor (ECF subfamily)